MSQPIRVLLVEDSREDAELLLLNLQAHGIKFTYVREDTLDGFLAAFESGTWDLVLSDFNLQGTDGMEILRCLRNLDSNIPFILFSGVLDEGAAVEAMRQGANDFLLKGNLSRLVPAIQREMKEAESRRKQRRFEEELRLLHSAIGQTPDMVVITDPEGAILYANAAAEAITGYQHEELLDQNPRLFKSGRHDAAFYRTMWETLLRGETWKGHIVNRKKDGNLWDAESVIAPVYNPPGDLQNYLWTARDSTLERQLQGLLEQSQRLETIGTLTSGIAHDFNNILMPVLGHAEMGLERLPGDPKLTHDLEVILASVKRARDLIRQILTFSRKGERERVPIEVHSLLGELIKLLRATVPTSIGFDVELAAEGKLVQGDPTQLHQVILNLCTNAGHAMQGNAGRMTIRLTAEHCSDTSCAMNIILPEGEYVCVEVTDTGRGIQPDHLDKIFLPFFTTKSQREGTGLGLSVSHGIVSSLGGGIQVTSRPGVGTSFKVFLPVSGAEALSPGQEEEKAPAGRGRILLVDDEAPLLEMLHVSLVRMGFRVASYLHPAKALKAYMQEPSAFQVLVTDHTMPGMSGLQLARSIWRRDPSFPAVLLTGDPEVAKAGEPIEQVGFRVCLTKPMSPKDLAKAILRVVPEMNRHDQI
jgi:PAS domain S-box-containing protein